MTFRIVLSYCILHAREIHVEITMSSVGIHYRSYRKVVIGRASSVTSLDEARLGVSVPSKKIEAAAAQRDEVRREGRQATGGYRRAPRREINARLKTGF